MVLIFDTLGEIDRKISLWVHECNVKPKFLEYIIFPFAYFHSPRFLPVVLIMIGYLFPRFELLNDDFDNLKTKGVNSVVQYIT